MRKKSLALSAEGGKKEKERKNVYRMFSYEVSLLVYFPWKYLSNLYFCVLYLSKERVMCLTVVSDTNDEEGKANV